jgi:protein TonB
MLPKSTLLSAPHTVSAGDVQREFLVEVPRDQPTYFEFLVEKPVRALPGQQGPRYPERLRNAAIEGEVLAQFVVDTLGHVDMSTFKVLKSTDPEFASAVRFAVPRIIFVPAELDRHKVRQLVQMPFIFCLGRSSLGACSG